VADDGTVHGLDADYASRSEVDKDPRDWFQQHLANIISTAMGDAAATNVRPYLHHVDGHDICRVQVDACGFPVDAKVIYQKPNGPKETRTEGEADAEPVDHCLRQHRRPVGATVARDEVGGRHRHATGSPVAVSTAA